MARVKNQVLFEDEESYTDAGGIVHYNGVGYRQGATEAYPGYLGAEYGTVRKSPRSRRPPQQGRGSPLQAPWRDCFSQCADRWNALPDVCGDDPACDPTSSKENVLTAKADAGVSCSAFDLYMRCCLGQCVTIDIYTPGGVTYSGGTIPDVESCFPCDDNLPAYSLAAASPTIPCGASVDLVIDPAPSAGVRFSIVQVSGGGSLEGGTYTAPATNPDCTLNPSFELFACDQSQGVFAISVNCQNNDVIAYWRHPGPCEAFNDAFGSCHCWRGGPAYSTPWHMFTCDGRDLGAISYYSFYGPLEFDICGPYVHPSCDCGPLPDTIDRRGDDMKAAGCCPPLL